MVKRASVRTEPLRSGDSIERLPEEYRPGATLAPYAAWCAVSIIAGAVLWERSQAVAVSLFIAGPLAFVLQLFRARRDAVTVDPSVGLRLANGAVIKWGRIRSVQERGIRLVFDTEPYYSAADSIGEMWRRPELVRFAFLGSAGLILLMGLYALVTGVLMPVMILLSPWQHRVVVTLTSGESLSWRDLRKPGSFRRRVDGGIQGSKVPQE